MGYWTIHAYVKCLKSSCERVLMRDHFLSCEHKALNALFGIKMLVVIQIFHPLQKKPRVGYFAVILMVIQGQITPHL